MAFDAFLRLDDVTGESKDDTHKDEMEILSDSWGMSQSGTTHSGPGGGAGKVSVNDLSLVKYVDKASPILMQFCATGQHIATGQLTIRKAGATPVEYLKLEMKEIIVTSVQFGGSTDSDRMTESISLNFAEFTLTYTPQKDDGTADAEVSFQFNIPAGVM